jgi:uncharacterized membrane protein
MLASGRRLGQSSLWHDEPVRSSRQRHDPGTVLSARRALIALGVGLIAGSFVALIGEPELWPVVTWTVATIVVLTWVWRILWPQDHHGTERLAEQESASRTTDTAILTAAVVSLGAVVLAIIRSSTGNDVGATAAVILSIVAVVLSWTLVNTVFALKYARLYYLDEDGGIDFKQAEPPAYSDFAYLAFTVGMSFAVSETEPSSTSIRKVALGHALLSFLFGTGILAVAINLVSNVGQS